MVFCTEKGSSGSSSCLGSVFSTKLIFKREIEVKLRKARALLRKARVFMKSTYNF